MLARSEGPRPCHGGGDADSIAGERLDKSLGATSAQVAVRKADHTGRTIKAPESDDSVQVVELGVTLDREMEPGTNKRHSSSNDVEDLEGLVPCVSQDAARLDEEESEGAGTDEAVQQERRRKGLLENSCEALLGGAANPVAQGMRDGLEYNNASNPTVKQVEGVERHGQPLDQRVVASSHEPQGDHVHDSKHTGTVTELIDPGVKIAVEGNIGDAEGNVCREVGCQAKELEPRGQYAHVDGGAEGELAVVSLAEKRGVLDAPLEKGISP